MKVSISGLGKLGASMAAAIASRGHEARPRLDAVRVLHRVGGDVHADLVTSQLLHQRTPFGLAGQHLQCGMGRGRKESDEQRRGDGKKRFHDELPGAQKP